MNTLLKTLCALSFVGALPIAAPASAVPADAHPAGAASAGDDMIWPARWMRDEQPATAQKGIILSMDDLPAGLQPLRTSRGVGFPSPRDMDGIRALRGEGDHPVLELRFEGPGAFLYAPAPQRRRGRAAQPDFHFQFISGRETEGHKGAPALKITRTWFAWYDAATDGKTALRGTVLLMPGMLGTPEPIIEHFVSNLRDEGYGILRMMCQPSRFTERILFEVDLDEPESAAHTIATEAGERLAECAYAVEAAFAHIRQERPQYKELPRIALGMSGGAMILPTVVAREADQYAAAILIAGGANMMAILEDSNYKHMINAADIRWSPAPPDAEQRRRFDDLYLSFAHLDPFHTATQLAGKPVLMLHATHDLAVPAVLGDLLWKQLGQPERWSEEAGHEELFMRLPQKVGDIVEWLNTKVAGDE